MQYINQQMAVPKQLIKYYPKLAINETELAVLLKLILIHHETSEMPSFEAMAQETTLEVNEVAALIQGLIQKDLLHVSVGQAGSQYSEHFSLQPLDDRLHAQTDSDETAQKQLDFSQLFERFEVQFGRPLTPIEMQTLTHWIDTDHHSTDLINAALDEATIHDKLSFKYIDRILLNWKKRHVKTVDDSKTVRKDFEQTKQLTKTIENFPVFDWVNGDNPYDK
ncbi:DnaD domain-containing protein [Macrococcus equipercicus]|uniref:DnaD domain protein n=1 Tax=Macrococcus equipercicus TaxID=69967 RepID=A0A9Q9BRN4_9STAP|nr:DnaD domain protein [Macrococcus equipercicus]KAA1040206.1 DnaD domain protein [Macrococcus equipercicus]UTH12849.1 DnaD domain protein [Macrococcus equipercicus]